MAVLYKAENEKALLEIRQDMDPESPREWCNIGKMFCLHSKYDLGDVHGYSNTEEFFDAVVYSTYSHEFLVGKACENMEYDSDSDLYSIKDRWGQYYEDTKNKLIHVIEDDPLTFIHPNDRAQMFEDKYVSLPLYLYDHSGITMNTYGFSCRWDSGQVGWIYAKKDKFREVTKYSDKELFEDGKAEEILRGEVKVYDHYLRGDVFEFSLTEKKNCDCCNRVEYNTVDSCSGFYGVDSFNGMKSYLPTEYHDLVDKLV